MFLLIPIALTIIPTQVFAQEPDILTQIQDLENKTKDLQGKIDELKEMIETVNKTLYDPEKCTVCEKTQPPPSGNGWSDSVVMSIIFGAFAVVAVIFYTKQKAAKMRSGNT